MADVDDKAKAEKLAAAKAAAKKRVGINRFPRIFAKSLTTRFRRKN